MTIVNEEARTEAPQPTGRKRLAGLRELGTRQVGGVPIVGVALAVLFVAVVGIALATVAPATPPAVRGAGAQASTPTASPLRQAAAVPPPADPFISGTTAGAVTLSWRAPRPLPVGYRVYRATGRYQPYAIVGTVNAPDINSFTDDTNLTPGTTYIYTVTAFDGQNESAPTAPVVAVLLPAPQQTATATTQPLGPAPALAPIPPRTLTAIAKAPRPAGTLPAALGPGAATTPGTGLFSTPVGIPGAGTSVAGVLTPASSVSTPANVLLTPLSGALGAATSLASVPTVAVLTPAANAPTVAGPTAQATLIAPTPIANTPASLRPQAALTVGTTKRP